MPWAYEHTPFDHRSLLADLRWLLLMWKLKRWTGAMSFTQRDRFFAELAPKASGGGRLVMPHAITHIAVADLIRGAEAALRK